MAFIFFKDYPMLIEKNKPLRELNTFRVEAAADYFVSVKSKKDIAELCRSGIIKSERLLILGGGSNVLFTGDFKGLVIHPEILGMNFKSTNDDYVVLETGAGESWNKFVETTVKNRLYGLENLALIPGKAGAAPVQNIGAYGIEQESLFEYAEGIDLETGSTFRLNKHECEFSYRNSIFKKSLKDKVIITSVGYKLSRLHVLNLNYKDLQVEKDKFNVNEPDQQWVFDAVCRIRKRKLPDPADLGNAGSFFKNPIITKTTYNDILSVDPTIPSYPAESAGMVKVPAARLIELCGWKGQRRGDAGVCEKHSLILVNYGKASGKEIMLLSQDIIGSVADKFGITLEREVITI